MHRGEHRFDSPEGLAKLRALDPWRNTEKKVARSLPDKTELRKLSREQLLRLLLKAVGGTRTPAKQPRSRLG